MSTDDFVLELRAHRRLPEQRANTLHFLEMKIAIAVDIGRRDFLEYPFEAPNRAPVAGAERDAYLAGSRRTMSVSLPLSRTRWSTRVGTEEARRVAGTMLPELLPYDPTRPASFPDNGRTLTDDAVDAFLAILTNRKVTKDKLGPHGDLLAAFPYLGPPHSSEPVSRSHG
jgi:hypothetical protein